MEPQIILNSLSIEQLRELIVDVFKEIKDSEQKEAVLKISSKSYLSRKEVSEIFQVSLPTLRQYVKKGFIQSHRIGRRILFKSIDVEQALTEVKMFKNKKIN